MKKRLETIFELIPKTPSFADVGCDHGFIAKQVIKSGKCNNVTVSDVSLPSLQKAEKLLKNEIESGLVRSVQCDGLKGISADTQTVLIAGMGGEEIIKIISESDFLPNTLILQPMKNVDKVRKMLFEYGYAIKKDFIFYARRYYNAIVATLNECVEPYSDIEYVFGRDNLTNRSEDFLNYLRREIAITERYVKNLVSIDDINEANEKLTLMKEVLNDN